LRKDEKAAYRWIMTTMLAIVGVIILIRLGIWQLDRLEWRRAFNARVTAQLNAAQLDLNRGIPLDELYDMEYRSVTVRGEYDPAQEVLLRNQVWKDRLGFHLLTPLKIEGSDYAVLVDRGWIPFDQADRVDRAQFDQPGIVQVSGMIRRGQEKPDFGGVPDPTLQPGETRLDAWNVINLVRIQKQTDLRLLPVYILQAPEPAWTGLPYRSYPEIELSVTLSSGSPSRQSSPSVIPSSFAGSWAAGALPAPIRSTTLSLLKQAEELLDRNLRKSSHGNPPAQRPPGDNRSIQS
jgi:surfeit locus 1 family protein